MAEKGTDGVFLNLIVKGVQDVKSEIKDLSKSLQTGQREIGLMAINLRKMVSIVKKLTDYTDDYVSSLRLMNTTFSDTSKEAGQFVDTLSEMIGLDEAVLTRQVSLFKQLGKSINLTDEYSTKFAKSLTTLSAKMAILYNKDYGVMATALQRAIQGTQETLKAMTGIEATEMAQQIMLTSHGINRQVSSLNEAERSIVMYASILDRVTKSNETYEEAVNSVAWQKQVLAAQVKRLGVALGSILYPILQKILPIFSAILMVLTEIITIFATMIGVTISGSASVDGATDAYNKLAGGIGAAGKEAKKQLRGFDKLNNITTPSKGGGGNALGIDEGILKLLDDVDKGFLNIRNKATEIRDKIMEWLGFVKIVDETTGETTWKLKEGYTNIEKIRDAILAVVTIFAGLKILTVITKATTLLKKLAKVLGTAKGTTGIVGAVSALGAKILAAFGVVGAGAVTTFIAGLGGVLVIIAAVYAAIRLIVIGMQDAIEETSILADTTVETRKRLEPVEEAFKNLRTTLSTISYDNLALTEDEKTKIVESINNLTTSMKTALDDYVASQLESANYLYYELGLITEQEYKEEIEKIAQFKQDSLNEIDQYGKDLNTSYETIYDENGNIIQRNYMDFLAKQQKYQTDFLTKLAETNSDAQTIIKNGVDISKITTIKGAEEQLTIAKNAKDDRIKVLEEERAKALQEVETLFKDDVAKREEYKQKVNEKYDEMVLDAKDAYHDIYNEMVVSNKDIAKYIDEDSGQVKSKWTVFWESMKTTVNNSIATIRKWWDNLKFNSKKVDVETETRGPITTYNIRGFASGGFPTEGELFMAREAGPELVGQINGRTAVANNDQITNGIRQATYQGMMSALASADFGADVTIEATGDASGLLDFITFKQKQRERQFN